MDHGVPVEVIRADAVRLLLGVVFAASGVAACLLWLPRARRRGFSLLYFGVAAFMYGVRLAATTATARYLLPHHTDLLQQLDWIITSFIGLPFILFSVETVAPQWKKQARWLVAVGFAFQCVLLAMRLLDVERNLAGAANNIMVLVVMPGLLFILFVPPRKADRELWIVRTGFIVFAAFAFYTNAAGVGLLSRRYELEFLGFAFLLCCLGYVAASQTVHNEERLISISKELEIARRIQSGLLPGGDVRVPELEIAARYVPATSVAGDFYDFLIKDGRELGVLVADVSGHGVPAALSASMVKIAIRSQAGQADLPAEVLTGLNSILYGNMQGQFVTAGYLFLNVEKRELAYAGAGHPPLLVWRARERRVESIEENGLFLGAFPDCRYSTVTSGFSPGDRCLLYTDGILEAPSPTDEEFGPARLKEFLAVNAELPARDFCDALLENVASWCARRPGTREQHDDLTVVMVEFKGR
jgi:sigma-B regulation protein RsbU (phosphoserine phosphatase)